MTVGVRTLYKFQWCMQNLFLQHVYLGFSPFAVQVTNNNSADWNGTGSLDCLSIVVSI